MTLHLDLLQAGLDSGQIQYDDLDESQQRIVTIISSSFIFDI